MRPFLLCVSYLLLMYMGYTQPIVPLSWAPEIGSEWKQRLLLETKDPGEQGENRIWDFSDISLLQAEGEITFHWIDPEPTQYRDSFPEATICADLELSGFGRGFTFGYYRGDDEGFEYHGSGSQFGIEVFDDPQTFAFIGLAYGQTVDDMYAGVRYSQFLAPDDFDGVTSYTYDAYGTLMLPEHAIPNAIRVYQLDVEMDTSGSGDLVTIDLDTTEFYAWIAEGSLFPIVLWERSVSHSRQYAFGELINEDFDGPDTAFSVNPDYAMLSSVREMKDLSPVILYPTLTTGEVHVELLTEGPENYRINAFNGICVTEGSLSGSTTLDVRHLISGPYILRIDGYAPALFIKQ